MSRVMLDEATQAKFDQLREPTEVCDGAGRTLGVFCPIINSARPSPHSIEELEELRKVRTGRTLTEIRADLNKQGIPL